MGCARRRLRSQQFFNQFVRFALVLIRGDDSQIREHVKSRDALTSQRDNVIHVVLNSSFFRQAPSRFIERVNFFFL